MNDFVQKRRRAPLSLTALIDIVFILLMFFMVTTSFTPLRSITLTQGVSESSKSDELPNFLLLREDGLIAQHSDSGLTFKTKAEQKIILEKIANGFVDLVVGTHRLLSPDIHAPGLSLLIVDEEQRFGVQHKEKIKKKIQKNRPSRDRPLRGH